MAHTHLTAPTRIIEVKATASPIVAGAKPIRDSLRSSSFSIFAVAWIIGIRS